MAEETTTKKTTTKKEPADKVVHFYFPRAKSAVYGFADDINVKAVNGVIKLNPKSEHDKKAIKLLRDHKDNGIKYKEVASGKSEVSEVGGRIDALIAMDRGAVIAILGGDIGLNRLTTGELIAKVLELD